MWLQINMYNLQHFQRGYQVIWWTWVERHRAWGMSKRKNDQPLHSQRPVQWRRRSHHPQKTLLPILFVGWSNPLPIAWISLRCGDWKHISISDLVCSVLINVLHILNFKGVLHSDWFVWICCQIFFRFCGWWFILDYYWFCSTAIQEIMDIFQDIYYNTYQLS